MSTLHTELLHHTAGNTPLALVTLMGQSGSAPRTAGARMLVLPDGSIKGTIGGGKYEADAIAAGIALMQGKIPSPPPGSPLGVPGFIMEFSLRGVQDMDMVCGGSLSLLLELVPGSPSTLEIFARAKQLDQSGLPYAFITRITPYREYPLEAKDIIPGTPAVVERCLVQKTEQDKQVFPENIPASVTQKALQLTSSQPQTELLEQTPYLLEFFPRASRLFFFGAGHVSLETVKLAHMVDFATHVIDDRKDFANASRFPASRTTVLPSLAQQEAAGYLEQYNPTSADGIIIVTRGHSFDKDVLAAALQTDSGYIGMIGSKTKRQQVYAALQQEGFQERDLAMVHCPIGLAIGAETPQEIAVSIVGELIQWRQEGSDK